MRCAPMQGLEDMTRTRDGLQRVPLMSGIGEAVFVYDITREEMGAAFNRLLQYAAAHGDAAALQAVAGSKVPATNNVVPFPVLTPVHTGPLTSVAAALEN